MKTNSRRNNWFECLFGFKESPQLVQKNIHLSPCNDALISTKNKRVFPIGKFTTPTVGELKLEAAGLYRDVSHEHRGNIEIEHIAITGVLELHHAYPNAIFQAASQFNCLEFCDPNIIPEDGITMYSNDRTQGPACAMAAAAGTLYRNYFVPLQGKIGQSKYHQINNLDEVESVFENDIHNYWRIHNGYSFTSNVEALSSFQQILRNMPEDILTKHRDLLKVGVHEQVGVTFEDTDYRFQEHVAVKYEHEDEISPENYAKFAVKSELANVTRVNQVYCSALSIAYAHNGTAVWEEFGKFVLDGIYEATLWYAVTSYLRRHFQHLEQQQQHSAQPQSSDYSDTVFLTFVGGGVFGNDLNWIAKSIARACALVQYHTPVPLKVKICHYRSVSAQVRQLINEEYAAELELAKQRQEQQEEQKHCTVT